MKLFSRLMPAMLALLLATPFAGAEEVNATQAYIFAVTRVAGFMNAKAVADSACRERFPEDRKAYDSRPFTKWKKRNARALADVEQHVDGLPHLLGFLNGTGTTAEEKLMSLEILKHAAPVLKAIQESNDETARKVCANLAQTLASGESELESRFRSELAMMRACKEKNVCTHLIPI